METKRLKLKEQRKQIVCDVRKAIEDGVSEFEFEGDGYDYDTLEGKAKDVLANWFCDEIYYPAYLKAKDKLERRIYGNFWMPISNLFYDEAIIIKRKKEKDRIHVYCRLELKILKNMEKSIFNYVYNIYRNRGCLVEHPTRKKWGTGC